MSIKSIYDFLNQDSKTGYQSQSMFEFRYPILFEDDSFLIDQLDYPKLDTNVGYIYLDGYKIPVHSTGSFDNEIRFSMYVRESDLDYNGKYYKIFHSLITDDKHIFDDKHQTEVIKAKITPLSYSETGDSLVNDINAKTIILYNAMIKSASMQGGFSSNSIALTKFDVTMTYAFFEYAGDNPNIVRNEDYINQIYNTQI